MAKNMDRQPFAIESSYGCSHHSVAIWHGGCISIGSGIRRASLNKNEYATGSNSATLSESHTALDKRTSDHAYFDPIQMNQLA
jgi:hypothetical protein